MTPDKFTNQELYLDVGEGHSIYIQDWGNPKAATPIVYLHGGPGNGCGNKDKKKFDPKLQRIIFHDQRGSGNSKPLGSLVNNTTPQLIDDIEAIANRLNLKEFVLAGGSWGSCLALAYGVSHPKRVKAMVLNGIFTGTKDEIDWLDKGGYKEFFPDVWHEYQESVPEGERHNPTAYHLKHALGKDKAMAKKSAYAYERAELGIMKLDSTIFPAEYEDYEPGPILIEMYYMANGCFMPNNYILDNAEKLTMPIWLVQGRYDMVCRPVAAARLDAVLPNSHLIWTINGHSGQHESNTVQQLLRLHSTGDI